MRHSTQARTLKLATWFAALLLPTFLNLTGFAQSGRRAPRSTPTPDLSTTNPATEPATKPVLTPALSRNITVLCARQPTSKRFMAEDAIFASFVNQLNRYESVQARSIGDLKRAKAARRARSEAEAFVVVLQFAVDSFQEGTILLNSRDLIVEYAVYAPMSDKVFSKGKVYFQQVGGGRLRKSGWPNGTPIKITTEATGIEAAEQLYASLALKVGVKH